MPLKSGSEVVGVLGLARPAGAPPFRQDELDLMSRLAQLASITLENAQLHTSLQAELIERVRAEEALQSAYQMMEQRVQERTHELATLNAIAAVVSRSLDLQEILNDALDKTMQAVGMERGAAYRLEEPDQMMTLIAHRGLSAEFVELTSRMPLQFALAGKELWQHEPVIWTLANYPENELKVAIQHEGLQLVVGIPLTAKGQLVGGLVLGTCNARAFTPEESSLLLAVGQQIGVAMENARLYEQAEQAAALAERNRLARELHDSVTQSLYSVTLYAEAAARLLTAGQHIEAADHLRELRDTAQEALREMRLLIFELRPPALEKSGLIAALQARLEAVEGRGGMLAEMKVEGAQGADRVPLFTQEQLYQIAREALNNALKHAHAQHVRVHVQFKEAAACLDVGDDGVGFDPEQTRGRGGLGLPGMRERAQKIGGRLTLTSAPGRGTTVHIEVETPRIGETFSPEPEEAA